MSTEPGEITLLLRAVGAGDTGARERLGELIYAELRKIASIRLRSERPNHTLTPTALANEAWLKLCNVEDAYQDRSHFFALAANAMRRVLTDYARARNATKRGGGVLIRVDEIDIAAPESDEQLILLDEALIRLSDFDHRAARVVELRYFAGLAHGEIADVLHVDRRTVDRDWATARAWLFDQIAGAVK